MTGRSNDLPAWKIKKQNTPKKAQVRDRLQGEVIYGVSPVLAALGVQRRDIFTLFIQISSSWDPHMRVQLGGKASF